MRLLLASSGLANEEIILSLEEMVSKTRDKINTVIINEAIKGESGDHRWFTEELQRLTAVLGGSMEFVDFGAHSLEYIRERIDQADMIFCFGGNTDYLANTFIKTGFDKILPEILAEKVWVGSSAGSCVLCHQESEEVCKTVYLEKRDSDHFMDIVPIIFMPHLHGWFEFDRAEVLEASKATDLPVYALSDDAALKVTDDNEPVILGTDYIIAQNGEIIAESK